MGNSQSIQKINYEDIQYVIRNSEAHILINTLNESEQECLLPNTVNINKETELINQQIYFFKLKNPCAFQQNNFVIEFNAVEITNKIIC